MEHVTDAFQPQLQNAIDLRDLDLWTTDQEMVRDTSSPHALYFVTCEYDPWISNATAK